MGNNVERILGRLANERGSINESKVARVFQDATLPKWIIKYETANKKDEHMGIDGWFDTDVGRIPLQIKSSKLGKAEALKKHPDIPTIVVSPRDDDKRIFNKCLSSIGQKRNEYLKRRQRD